MSYKKKFYYCFKCNTKTVYYIKQFKRYHCLNCLNFVSPPDLTDILNFFKRSA